MTTKYQFNITAVEHDVLERIAGRIQRGEGVVLSKEQIVFAALEALRQDACVRELIASKLLAHMKSQ